MAKTYSEKLKDPRWQKKRLEILSRDEFTCQACKNSKDSLSVHHKYYDGKKEPWDYDSNTLVTLCNSCHTEMDSVRKSIVMMAGYMTIEELITLDMQLMTMPGMYERIYGKELEGGK